jgi:hypothetical protein
MLGLNIWDIFGFIAFIFLVLFFYAEENVVWRAFKLSIIIAVIAGVVYLIKDGSWPWGLFKKILVVITLFGVLLELINRLGNAVKKSNR